MFIAVNYTCICFSSRNGLVLPPWLCMNATLPGSWWHHRRHKGSLLCVFPLTTPRPPQTTGWGSHPASRPSTWRPSWPWSQRAAGPAAHSSTWQEQDLVKLAVQWSSYLLHTYRDIFKLLSYKALTCWSADPLRRGKWGTRDNSSFVQKKGEGAQFKNAIILWLEVTILVLLQSQCFSTFYTGKHVQYISLSVMYLCSASKFQNCSWK